MTLNFSDAPPQYDGTSLIPHGTLAWGVLCVRYYNFDQRIVETPSKSSEARFLDCEVTITGGDYGGRKVWTRIGTAGSEKYVNMGRSAIRAILETGRGASAQNPSGYQIQNYDELDEMQVALKIKIEPGKDGYQDKNDVAVWLSPVDPATAKDFQRLVNGDTAPKDVRAPAARPGGTQGGPAAGGAPAWAGGGVPSQPQLPQQTPHAQVPPQPQPVPVQAPQMAQTVPGRPSWLPGA